MDEEKTTEPMKQENRAATARIRLSQRVISGMVLGAGMFLMGGIGLAYEYSFSKLSSDLLGNSARQWAIIIAVMMLFMGIGADVQKYFRDRNLVDKLILSEVALGLLGGFGPLGMLITFGRFPEYFALVQYFLICSVGMLIGFEIPLVTRINESYAKNLRYNLARILKMDYAGSLFGALVWIFVLPRFFTLLEGAVVLGLVSMLVAGLTLVCFRDQVARRRSLLLTILFCSFGLLFSLARTEEWTVNAEQHLFRDRVLYTDTSVYQHVALTESRTGVVKCYLNGHIQFSSDDEAIYHENLVHPAMLIAPRRDNVLVLGGGDGLAVREVLRYSDVYSVTLVDIDPMMTTLAREHPILRSLNEDSLRDARTTVLESNAISPGGAGKMYAPYRRVGRHRGEEKIADIQIMNIDAIQFVEEAEGSFDVIILDFPDPNSPELATLYSEKFYRSLGKRLAADGILVSQSTSPYHAKEAFLCVGRTLLGSGFGVAPYHDNVPSFGEWGWWIGGHDYVYDPERIKRLLKGIERTIAETRYLNADLIGASLVFGKGRLESLYEDISTLSAPRVHTYYLMGWQESL